MRAATTGDGSGRILSLVTDGGGTRESTGPQGALAARSDDTTGTASMWTVMLRPEIDG